MKNISYMDLRLNVLDDFYLRLVDNPKENLRYDEVLDYVSYDYESGFSETECFIVNFVLYVLCSDFQIAKDLSEILRNKLITIINSKEFKSLIKQITVEEDRVSLLHDMYLVGLITKTERDSLNELKNI